MISKNDQKNGLAKTTWVDHPHVYQMMPASMAVSGLTGGNGLMPVVLVAGAGLAIWWLYK